MLIKHWLGPTIVLALFLFAIAGIACSDREVESVPLQVSQPDRIDLPPVQAEYRSPGGDYRFIISSADNWKSPQGRGRLMRQTAVVWEGGLPQEYGPRYVLVSDRGQVLMLDEGINVNSKYAIAILNPQQNRTIYHNFEQVREVLALPASTLVQQAAGGSWWISQQPSLDESGTRARIAAGGKILTVDLETGAIAIAP